jgi:hypothetical protein
MKSQDRHHSVQAAFKFCTWGLALGVGLLGSFGQVTPTLTASADYDTWASSYLPIDIGPAAADFDGDGLKNEAEYIFGLDPTASSSANPISVPFDKTTSSFTYTRRSRALTKLYFNVITSSNLTNWARDQTAVQSVAAPVNGIETVTVTVTASLLTAANRFFRIEATDNPFQ